jgi:acetylornithine deacetylase/succinyl-diaminopimelate desuccinylase-like protein
MISDSVGGTPKLVNSRWTPTSMAAGWNIWVASTSSRNAPRLSPWLEQAVADASQHYFGAPAAYMGEGGSIPFMGMLGEKFPKAQFLITGVLGPHSNAHGPNEFLHIPTGKKVSMVVADVVARHYLR